MLGYIQLRRKGLYGPAVRTEQFDGAGLEGDGLEEHDVRLRRCSGPSGCARHATSRHIHLKERGSTRGWYNCVQSPAASPRIMSVTKSRLAASSMSAAASRSGRTSLSAPDSWNPIPATTQLSPRRAAAHRRRGAARRGLTPAGRATAAKEGAERAVHAIP